MTQHYSATYKLLVPSTLSTIRDGLKISSACQERHQYWGAFREEGKPFWSSLPVHTCCAEAIAAATPRGEKSSSASEPKIELSATKVRLEETNTTTQQNVSLLAYMKEYRN